MEVRCERCATVYEFDESRIPDDGLAVKCTNCGHVFRAHRGRFGAAGDEWSLRQNNGSVSRCPDLATLQRWIVERRVTRADEVSRPGQAWQHLGDIPDLLPFFAAIEGTAVAPPAPWSSPFPANGPLASVLRPASAPAAPAMPAGGFASVPAVSGAQWESNPQELRSEQSGAWQMGATPDYGATVRTNIADDDDDDDLDFKPRRSGRKAVVLLLAFCVVAVALAIYRFQPELFRRLLGKPAVNELAMQQVASALIELNKDSFAAMTVARGQCERALALEGKYTLAKVCVAQADLSRAEYLNEEISELSAKLAGASAGDQDRVSIEGEINKRKAEAQELTGRAFEQAKAVLQLDPSAAGGLRLMADYYRIMNAPESMKTLLDQARQKAPKDAWVAYVSGASVASDAALAERAIRYFDEALALQPTMQRARYKLARVYLVQNNKDKAQSLADAIIKDVPDHERATALVNELKPPPPSVAEPPAAPAVAPPVVAKAPGYEQLFAQAERLREADKPKQALKLYQQALEQQPDDPDAHTGLGWCYSDLESYDTAISSFSRALKLVPRFSDAHFGIAEAYRLKGQNKEAAEHYRAYLDIVPDGEDAVLAKRMLSSLEKE